MDSRELDRVEGATVYDVDGDKVGKVEQIYLDDHTGQPSWVTVNTGLFGTSQSFVPLQDASFNGEDLHVRHSKDTVKDAPRIDGDRHLDRDEESALYRHYGLTDPTGGVEATTGTDTSAGHGHDTTHGVGTDVGAGQAQHAGSVSEESAVTRSEERLSVDKDRVQTGTARLRKYTTTETQSVEVPVSKEKLVVERTPASGAATGAAIADDGEQVEEITLTEERVRVEKEAVPVEEVRIGKETVTEQEQVTEQVRKEHVEVEGDVDETGPRVTR